MTTNRTYIGIGVVDGFVALSVLWSLFRPELLFVNATVNEAAPVAVVSAPPTASSNDKAVAQPTAATMSNGETTAQATAPDAMVGTAPTAVAAQPATWSATFQGLAHETKGTANVRVLEDGSRVLRLEDFMTSNGPDVRVYLVRVATERRTKRSTVVISLTSAHSKVISAIKTTRFQPMLI